jgi:hypothetical protein
MAVNKPNINLFIVGAAKAGTTSLYNYLYQHSQVFFPLVKEPNYYSRAEAHNPNAYAKPKLGKFYHNKIITDERVYYSLFQAAQNFQVVGDASPSYLWDTETAQKIYNDFPEAKIVILLRNPVQRAYSQFLMDLKDGNQSETDFLKALNNDKNKQPNIWGRAHLYEELGLYYNQVKQYIDVFSKDHVKIILYEDFIKNTETVLLDTFDFLNLNIQEIDTIDFNKTHNPYTEPKNKIAKQILRIKNKSGIIKRLAPSFIKNYLNKKVLFKPGTKPELSIESKTYLNNIYSNDINELEKLINKDLSLWKTSNY